MTVLILVRHGEAVTPGPSMTDRARPLTQKGRSDILRLADEIATMLTDLPTLYHSPYLRTHETAEIIHQRTGGTLKPQTNLVPSGSPNQVQDLILGESKTVLLVTHMPLVGELAESLLGRRFPFFPGTGLCMQRQNPYTSGGHFLWIKHPA